MRRRRLRHQRPKQFERALLVVMLFPYVLVKVTLKLAFNYSLLAIALMTPVDWNEEEEDLLRKALWHGYRPDQLVFTFWRRAKDIEAKAKEIGLL